MRGNLAFISCQLLYEQFLQKTRWTRLIFCDIILVKGDDKNDIKDNSKNIFRTCIKLQKVRKVLCYNQ